MKPISFGTSGHRGIIGDAFTPAHVRAIALAITAYLKQHNPSPGIGIGYDPRQGNSPTLDAGSFTQVLVDTFIDSGVSVHLMDQPSPTPLMSWYVPKAGLDGGIMLTASHNPPTYNGLKFNPKTGAPASVAITRQLQDWGNDFLAHPEKSDSANVKGRLTRVSVEAAFVSATCAAIESAFDIQRPDLSAVRIAIDVKHGATAKVWQAFEAELGYMSTMAHAEPRSDFGGLRPNPTDEAGLDDLKTMIGKGRCAFGIANDPDGDRHVLLDAEGALLTPEVCTTIFMDYFTRSGRTIKVVGTTLASSRLVKVAAEKLGVAVEEGKVGFKYFTDLLAQAKSEGYLAMAVESSGGITASCHSFEKCGFFPAILMLYVLAESGKSLSELRADCLSRYGRFNFVEDAFTFVDKKRDLIATTLSALREATAARMIGEPVAHVDLRDGSKLIFDNGDWVLLRLSGTEPVVRIYAESQDVDRANALVATAVSFIAQL